MQSRDRRGHTRREVLKLIGAGSAGMALAACAPITSAPAQNVGRASPTPKAGGTLRLNGYDLTVIDPHVIGPNWFISTWQTHDRLISYDDQLRPTGRLAERFELSSDLTQIKIDLRRGVQFHTGRELTAEDVRWNIERVKDPRTGVAQLANQSRWFSSVETPDRFTVILKSDQPRPSMFDFFEYFNITDRRTVEDPAARGRIVGTGPFMWAEYVQGDRIRLTKNPNYWQSGRPYLDEVHLGIRPDPQATIIALESGALDAVDAPTVRDASRLKADGRYRFHSNANTGQYNLIAANATVAPTNDKRVRQAINWAIDRRRWAETVVSGVHGPAKSLPWPTRSPAFEAAKNDFYRQDLERARALFRQVGDLPEDFEIAVVSTNTQGLQLAQILQADLQKIGVRISIRTVEPLASRAYIDGLRYRGLTIGLSGFAGLEPSSLFTLSRFWNYRGASQTGFTSPAYTSLVESALVEPDAGKRKALYSQLNDLVLDESFIMILSAGPGTMLTTQKVHGVRWDAHEAYVFSDVWIA